MSTAFFQRLPPGSPWNRFSRGRMMVRMLGSRDLSSRTRHLHQQKQQQQRQQQGRYGSYRWAHVTILAAVLHHLTPLPDYPPADLCQAQTHMQCTVAKQDPSMRLTCPALRLLTCSPPAPPATSSLPHSTPNADTTALRLARAAPPRLCQPMPYRPSIASPYLQYSSTTCRRFLAAFSAAPNTDTSASPSTPQGSL